MNCNVERVETNVVKLEITVSKDKFREALNKSYKKNAGKFNLPGFRKGKAPMNMIEKMYGESVFFEDAINFVCEETYPVAIKENGISPVDYPEIDIVEIGKDVDFKYTAKVVVKPEVKLGDYKNIEAKKVVYTVTEEDINAQLNAMREKNARIITKEDGEVVDGDIVTIDFEGFIDGVAFEGGKAENYDLTVGSGTFIPGFEPQLVGAKIGETKDVNVTFPEDYHGEELKGKEALFKVAIKSIKTKELPELDDEFAKDTSEFDTLEELRADMTKKNEANNEARAKKDFNDEVIKLAVDAAEVEIPEIMISKEIDYMVKDLDYRLSHQGLSIDKYAELMGITIDTIKNDFKEIAANKVKTNLVLEAIAKVENIVVADEEVEKRAEEIAKIYGQKDVERIKQTILRTERPIIEEELVNNKVVEFLLSVCKVVE